LGNFEASYGFTPLWPRAVLGVTPQTNKFLK